jgi:hypothetical protein
MAADVSASPSCIHPNTLTIAARGRHLEIAKQQQRDFVRMASANAALGGSMLESLSAAQLQDFINSQRQGAASCQQRQSE